MITHSIIQKSQIKSAHRIDAEYFQPEYLELEKKIHSTNSCRLWRNIEGRFITGPFGSEFGVENYTSESQYRYVRGKDVKEFFLLNDDNVYIPEKDYERLKKYSLKEGDVLVSVVGTLGNAAIVDSSTVPAIFSCKSTVFRTNSINSHYFIAYLNSQYGSKLLKRSVRGAVQTGLNIGDLKSLPVFISPQREQESIASSVLKAKQEYYNSKSLYSQAEVLFLEKLGLNNFIPEEELSYKVNLSDVKSAHRADAEYFQPKYGKLISKIKNGKIFSDAVENLPSRFNPVDQPDKVFKYVELSNIDSSIGVIDGYSEVLGQEAPSRAKRILKSGDVIVSSVQGSLGKVALVSQEQDGFLASTGFFQFRSKEILPEVLLVLARSPILQMQLEKQCAGTILTAVPKEGIKNIVIPILGKTIQEGIADSVHQSHQARKKAKELLEKAKREVEELIERGQSYS